MLPFHLEEVQYCSNEALRPINACVGPWMNPASRLHSSSAVTQQRGPCLELGVFRLGIIDEFETLYRDGSFDGRMGRMAGERMQLHYTAYRQRHHGREAF